MWGEVWHVHVADDGAGNRVWSPPELILDGTLTSSVVVAGPQYGCQSTPPDPGDFIESPPEVVGTTAFADLCDFYSTFLYWLSFRENPIACGLPGQPANALPVGQWFSLRPVGDGWHKPVPQGENCGLFFIRVAEVEAGDACEVLLPWLVAPDVVPEPVYDLGSLPAVPISVPATCADAEGALSIVWFLRHAGGLGDTADTVFWLYRYEVDAIEAVAGALGAGEEYVYSRFSVYYDQWGTPAGTGPYRRLTWLTAARRTSAEAFELKRLKLTFVGFSVNTFDCIPEYQCDGGSNVIYQYIRLDPNGLAAVPSPNGLAPWWATATEGEWPFDVGLGGVNRQVWNPPAPGDPICDGTPSQDITWVGGKRFWNHRAAGDGGLEVRVWLTKTSNTIPTPCTPPTDNIVWDSGWVRIAEPGWRRTRAPVVAYLANTLTVSELALQASSFPAVPVPGDVVVEIR